MNRELKIYKCVMDNLDSVVRFYDGITEQLEKNINYPKWTRGDYPGEKSISQAISEGAQYVCGDKDEIAGAFVLNDDPQGDYDAGNWRVKLRRGEYLVIHAFATAPEARRSGLGGYMVEYCIETARKCGYKALRLDVVPTNVPARGLYEKMGFTCAGEKDLSRGIAEVPVFALYELNF